MPRRFLRGRTLALSITAGLLLSAPAALALVDDPADEPVIADEAIEEEAAPESGTTDSFGYVYDAAKGMLYLDLTAGAEAPEGDTEGGTEEGDPADVERVCLPEDDAGEEGEAGAGEATEDSVPLADGEEPALPDGCFEIDVTGPSGQINHGTVVSSTVHAIKAYVRANSDGPLGHVIRDIAKTDLGKKKHGENAEYEVEGADDDTDLDDEDEKDDEKGEAHDKKGGNGNGPPDHAKAKGRNK